MLDVDLAMDVMQKFGKRVKGCEVSGELGIEYKEAMCKDRRLRWGQRSHEAQNVTADNGS
jgi:hypothetical protein